MSYFDPLVLKVNGLVRDCQFSKQEFILLLSSMTRVLLEYNWTLVKYYDRKKYIEILKTNFDKYLCVILAVS